MRTGGPGQRLVALLDGEVEAANLLDPEIPIAEARGLRKLAQGEFPVITFWVSPTIGRESLGKFFGALKLAEEALERDTEKYLHLWERNIPPALAGDYDFAYFGRGEKLIFEPIWRCSRTPCNSPKRGDSTRACSRKHLREACSPAVYLARPFTQ